METTHLGRTGLEVSRICLGTMNFGAKTEAGESFTIMDRALDCGINFFDTANIYGARPGATEEVIGEWFSHGGARREKVVLATKVYAAMGEWPNEKRLSARHIRHACEASLRRLGTDYIDLYQMHHVDLETPWEEIWQAMEQLVREGKVLYVGSSNFAAWNIVQANEIASRRHSLGLVCEQSLYNLLVRSIELEVLPACREYGVGVIAWSPLAGSLLGGSIKQLSEGRAFTDHRAEAIQKHHDQLVAFERFCDELAASPSDVALAWLLAQPGLTAPIIGPRTIEQFDGCLGGTSLELSAEALSRLDDIFPGPGGPAPQAYAW